MYMLHLAMESQAHKSLQQTKFSLGPTDYFVDASLLDCRIQTTTKFTILLNLNEHECILAHVPISTVKSQMASNY